MAKILWAPGIEEVSGALTKINRKSMHVDDQNMFLATHRKAATTSTTCSRAYFRKTNMLPWNGTTQPSSAVLQQREQFADFVKKIRLRRGNLAAITYDQQVFLQIRPQLLAWGARPTYTQFLWKLLMHFNGTYPTTNDYTFTAEDYRNAAMPEP